MAGSMTRERATEFGAAWNSGDADLVASFFADDGVYHASVGPDRLGKKAIPAKRKSGAACRHSSIVFPTADLKT